ncbi:1-deoxy-D-xylulose-5-phosphate reductoisomerase [Sediminibacillus dalangtanensis]|uniref:1-deoxy-D-xylulose 5-phosphate reductoisomerase n=1 Tax=Sediminibacillus dalangtanensis TaxID=2729421 RepID=A0ABX7VUJ2_9BACI|nr:1-deoxy-D-xylulose-5-phosphate reductoisomerase [Sediminibacillus dalangtanensis]QTM99445.1 1-deoxy-D-xylulose-5-phosphate reductoisomerase [Sediminibacillus dalangtanensis]
MKNIALLGATGSIGLQTLDVIREHPEAFSLFAMGFGENIDKAIPIIKEFNPKIVVVGNDKIKHELQDFFPRLEVVAGKEGLVTISTAGETDIVVNAVMGSIGLQATLQAIEHRKQVALANKETLVTAGHLVMEKAKQYGVQILPVDSEHSAIFQCLNGENEKQLNQLILTASGGSFRDRNREDLIGVTREDALKHPNWNMGAKITIDSATMMNKGLEVIEAHWLFGVPYDRIDVMMHKESVIHSMVEFADNSVIAQLGTPDMRVPIQYALNYPDRLELSGTKRLDLIEIGKLHFSEMDLERFPCLKMAYEAGKEGGTMTTVLNAANEAAVQLFLQDKISFLQIEALIKKALDAHQSIKQPDLQTILEVDRQTRSQVLSYLD